MKNLYHLRKSCSSTHEEKISLMFSSVITNPVRCSLAFEDTRHIVFK